MALSPSQIRLVHYDTGTVIRSGSRVLSDVTVGGSTDYTLLEVHNTSGSDSLTGARAWLTVDPDGAAVAIAVPDSTARALSYSWSVTPSGLTYSTPTAYSSGLALVTLTAGTKTLIVLRRVLSSATPADPESNTLRVTTA